MSTADDRPGGEPVPPAWDAPPQPPAWDRPPAGGQQPADPAGWSGQPHGAHPASGYGPPPGYGAPQTSSKAIIALVLAVGSFVVLPLLPAIVALVLARKAREEMDASGGRVGGDGLVTAARVIAWVNIGLCVAAVVLGVLAVVLLAGVGFGA